MSLGVVVFTIVLAWSRLSHGTGYVDEFQCVCGQNVWINLHDIRNSLELCRDCWPSMGAIAEYGKLTSRILLVVHNRHEPSARWLWLLNMCANTVTWMSKPTDGFPLSDTQVLSRIRLIEHGLQYIFDELNPFLNQCRQQKYAQPGRWSRVEFEKFILEKVNEVKSSNETTSGKVNDEKDYEVKKLYLNFVGASPDSLKEIFNNQIGIEWTSIGHEVSMLYNAARAKWVYGTRELVLYQKNVIAAVEASIMGYLMIHVLYCQEYWSVNLQQGVASNKDSVLGDYQRMWMSIGNLIDKFNELLDLRTAKYYQSIIVIVNNPAMDIGGFQNVSNTIREIINEISSGMFYLKNVCIKRLTDDPEKMFVETIALIDNNISSAEAYIKNVRRIFSGVDFKIIKEFMRSTHVYLT